MATGRIEGPGAIAGITSQLVFHVSPLSAKGMLSQQVEDAIKALDKANGAATILKLRAFVVGTGDLRRVQAIVNDLFTIRKWPLPVVTTIQAGAFPLEGAQVMIEAISEEKKIVNPTGLLFVPAVEGASGSAAMAALKSAMGSSASAMLRVTCFADSLAEADAARAAAARAFPKSAGVFLQSTRYTMGTKVACEGIAQGGPTRSAKVLFTAQQFGFNEDAAGMIEKMDRALESQGAKRTNSALIEVYGTSLAVAAKARAAMSPAPATAVFIEGLPALDATIAMEAAIPID